MLSWQKDVYKDLIESEGGHVDHPNDRGGPTNKGVTLRTLQGLKPNSTIEDLKNLSDEDVVTIYVHSYGAQFHFVEDKTLFSVLLNGSVNHGPVTMAKILQRAVDMGVIDGKIGPFTQQAVIRANLENPTRLLGAVVAGRLRIYADLVQKDHTQRGFAAGWFSRLSRDLT